MTDPHYCYILELVGDPRFNYVGYTVNMARRIRQHNGELVGGARITSRKADLGHRWRVIALLTSDEFDRRRALSCEWWIKHPYGRKRDTLHVRGSAGRVRGLVAALTHPKFAEDRFTIWVLPEFRTVLEAAARLAGTEFLVLDLVSLTPHVALSTPPSDGDTHLIQPRSFEVGQSASTICGVCCVSPNRMSPSVREGSPPPAIERA